jgi:ATP-binding cassette subfamily F protein uup
LTFNEQKEFQKIEREIKDLEYQKKQIEQLFSDGKVIDEDIEKKANELQKIHSKIEEKEERWFEFLQKWNILKKLSVLSRFFSFSVT